MKRRNFLQWISLFGGALWSLNAFHRWVRGWGVRGGGAPLVVSTWNFTRANEVGWNHLKAGQAALDAVEAGIRFEEANPDNHTVGFGGRPDREGEVSLDAAVMDEDGNAGSVACLCDIMHPISVARTVMEKTPHVMLSGAGARRFAIDSGFQSRALLTEEAGNQYEEWLKTSKYKPRINVEQHDTIGMIALDSDFRMAEGCSTSGLAYKMPGRVADSCLIGAGVYLDPAGGAAVATGYGEHIMKTAGSFLAVEEMRRGTDPDTACKRSIERIYERTPAPDYQAALLACNTDGRVGAFSIKEGFGYTLSRGGTTVVRSSASLLK